MPHYDFGAADVILAVDSDFLASGPFHLRYARQFADRRRVARPADPMNRLYVVESSYSPTGAAADHRFAVRPRDVAPVLRALLASLGGASNAPPWLSAVARDLSAHSGRAVVVVGAQQPAEVRALADAINAAIGANGHTTWHAPSPLIGQRVPVQPFGDLVEALDAGTVDTLVVVGGNPSYATPASLAFSSLMRRVPNSGYVGLYENETARDARWFVPMSHYLESWGDARAYDGTLSVVQPLVNPLYESITPAELYATMSGAPAAAYDLLRASFAARATGDADAAWSDALQRGLVPDTAFSRGAAMSTLTSTPAKTSPTAA
ncbi:MAG: TAT-variant-translocated molybdopterin oxidoreductase, partial [Gemmatimonadaceae bacterium]